MGEHIHFHKINVRIFKLMMLNPSGPEACLSANIQNAVPQISSIGFLSEASLFRDATSH
jgi:hypothetical protein